MADKRVAVRLDVEGAEQVRTALIKLGADGEAALKRLNFDTGKDTGTKALNSLFEEGSNAARQYASQLGPLGNILGTLGGGYLAAGAAAGLFATVLFKGAEAAEAESQAQAKLKGVLDATGHSAGLTSVQITEMVEKLSGSTNFTREQALTAASQLATFQNIGPQLFGPILSLSADMAAALGTDLPSAVEKFGRAFEDPIQGMTRLSRAGVVLTAAQKETIRNLEQSGDLFGAQNALLNDVKTHFDGVAASMHTGITGAAHDAGEAWHDFLITLGETTGVSNLVSSALAGLASSLRNSARPPQGYEDYPGEFPAIAQAKQYGKVDHTGSGKPYQVSHEDADALLGPIREAQERSNAITQALKDAVDKAQQDAREGAKGGQSRFISQHLDEIAKSLNLNEAGLEKSNPQLVAQLKAALAKDFTAQNSTKNEKAANKQSEAVGEATKFYDQLDEARTKAQARATEAEDATNEALLRGKKGYYAAQLQALQDWYADQKAENAAETTKQTADLSDRNKKFQDEFHTPMPHLADDTQAINDAANARALAAQQQFEEKKFAITQEGEGKLKELIDRGNDDLNTSLKGVAADGLENLQAGFMAVIQGSENVGKAFDKLAASFLADLAKMVFQQQVESPLAGLINGAIGGPGGGGAAGAVNGAGNAIGGWLSGLFGSAKGNVFDSGMVRPFAYGGVIDGPVVVPMALMGEAGPEAVVPLKRGLDGKLGISGGAGGATHMHFSPQIYIGGNVTHEDLQNVRDEMNAHQRNLPTTFVKIHAEAKSRGIIK